MSGRVARDAQVDAWAAELRAIAAEELGDGDAPQQAIEFPASAISGFASRFLSRVGEMLTSAYVTAAGGMSNVTDAGWQKLAGLIDAQTRFGHGFVSDLRKGKLSSAQAQARAAMYAGAAVTAYEQGVSDAAGFDAPAQPGEGSPCGTQCRCHWDIETFDDRIEGTWVAHDDKRVCSVCAERADEWAPYVQRLDGASSE